MARNRTLREVADKLPPMNKITADGKLLYNEKGRTIKADHFKEMLKLKSDIEKAQGKPKTKAEWEVRHRLELEVIANYTLGVQTMYKKMKQRQRVQIYKNIISFLSISALVIYIWYRYF